MITSACATALARLSSTKQSSSGSVDLQWCTFSRGTYPRICSTRENVHHCRSTDPELDCFVELSRTFTRGGSNRRLPGCVFMGINRTRRLFGRQKKDAWAASQYTLYGFRPRCYHFLSPLFLFFSLWSRKLHFRYAHRYFLDIYGTLEQSKELSRRGFWLDDRCLKMTIRRFYFFASFFHFCWRSFTHFFVS